MPLGALQSRCLLAQPAPRCCHLHDCCRYLQWCCCLILLIAADWHRRQTQQPAVCTSLQRGCFLMHKQIWGCGLPVLMAASLCWLPFKRPAAFGCAAFGAVLAMLTQETRTVQCCCDRESTGEDLHLQ